MNRTDHDPGKKEAAAERRVKALELRKAGAPYRTIGAQLGVSEKTAYQDVQKALAHLAELELASAEEYRTLELVRLDTLTGAAARVLASSGDGMRLAAIDRLLRISESRRKLLGLDAPHAIDVHGGRGEQQLIGVVLSLLAPYPELKLLLAEQLDQVIDATDVDQPSGGA